MAVIAETRAQRIVYKFNTVGTYDALSEPELATDPGASGGQILRHVSENLNLAFDAYTPNEITTDQQAPMERKGTRRVSGGINGLLSPGTQADLFEAVLRGTWSAVAVAGDETNYTSVAADSVTSKFTFASGDPAGAGYKVGQVIRFTGLSEVANNGVNFYITAMGGTNGREVTVYPKPTTMSADTEFDVTTVGGTLIAPASGHVRRKAAIEVYNGDSDVARVYSEYAFGGFDFSIAPNQAAQLNFTGMGRNKFNFSGVNAPFFTNPTAETTSRIVDSMDGLLLMGGSVIGAVTALSFAANRNPAAPATINPQGRPAGVIINDLTMTGQFTAFEVDTTFDEALKNKEQLSLLAFLPESNLLAADAVTFFLPYIEINSTTPTDIDGARAVQCGFAAARYRGAAIGIPSTTIQIVDTTVTA